MLEDISEMQAEDLLPPLTDQIRDEMGNEKAEQFMNAAKGTLESLLDATQLQELIWIMTHVS